MGRSFFSGQRVADAWGRRHRQLARSRSDTLSVPWSGSGHRPRRDPRGNRLAGTAGLDADRAGELGGESPNRIVVLAASALDALDELDSGGAVQDLAAVEGRLARLFGPPASLSADIDPMLVETPADVRAAEGRLLRSLVKDTDGFMARHVERPISLQISRRLAGTAITPIK